MYNVKLTSAFSAWLSKLSDAKARVRLSRRLEKAQAGNLGDIKSVGEGVMEMREFFGPGWRMYFVQRGDTLILMLGGGNKSTQAKDIAHAKALAKSIGDT